MDTYKTEHLLLVSFTIDGSNLESDNHEIYTIEIAFGENLMFLFYISVHVVYPLSVPYHT